MLSFFWTYTWWDNVWNDTAALAAMIHSFLYEWIWNLMIVLLVYYVVTWKKHFLAQTIPGILCAIGLGAIHFVVYPKIYEIIVEQERMPHSLSFWIGLTLAVLMLFIVLATIVLCVVNLVRRRTFSKKQVLWLTIPLWGLLAVHLILNFLPGGNNPLIGLHHLLLALLLTLTLTGKEQFFFHQKIVSASSEINANLEARSE